jgi:alcohol dehydrogenase class IV
MTGSFGLIRTPKIIFGPSAVSRLAAMLKNPGGQVLIITGSKSLHQNKGIADLLAALEKEKIILHFDRISKEPSPEEIDRITNRFRYIKLQAVIAVGGGSVMDAGKAVSAMLPLECSVKEYLEGVGTKSHPGIKKFFVAIPTTSGTGSEATANAVISGSDLRGGFKRSLRHENLVPDLAIVDPMLTLSCPGHITASSGMDAFTQLIESYLSLKSGPLTDALALDGIEKVRQNLEVAWKDGENTEARTGMAYAALLSGITLANSGLGLVHGFASSIGGACDIPHGVICATMMGVVNRYNIRSLIDHNNHDIPTEKYTRLGKLFSDMEGKGAQWYMQFAADYLEELIRKLNISRLGVYGLTPEHLEKIASETDHKSNPVRFEKERLIQMLKERL